MIYTTVKVQAVSRYVTYAEAVKADACDAQRYSYTSFMSSAGYQKCFSCLCSGWLHDCKVIRNNSYYNLPPRNACSDWINVLRSLSSGLHAL